MLDLLLYFSIALILSWLGSLPIGLITLTITQKTIEKGKKAGWMIAFGATIIEFAYTYIALLSLDLFTENTNIGRYIKIFATVAFFGMGIYFLLKKNKTNLSPVKAYDYFDFLRGIIVGMMNMLIIPFWIFLGIWLESNGVPLHQHIDRISFSIGAALGALIAFWMYIWLSTFITKKIKTINQYTNKAVGVLMLGLGLFQLIQLL